MMFECGSPGGVSEGVGSSYGAAGCVLGLILCVCSLRCDSTSCLLWGGRSNRLQPVGGNKGAQLVAFGFRLLERTSSVNVLPIPSALESQVQRLY